ncbi:armadillo-type protein [Umbelopsis sp. AD052]|nr:armadillo-type protein [Umbelopsis sp. AD052]
MDPNSVYQLFVATYHPDPNVHKQAELTIRNIDGQNGFLTTVLHILSNQETELGARQAAAIYFKNRISKAWDTSRISPSVSPIDPAERVVIKEQLLNVMTKVPQAVKVQLTASLNTILTSDFPDQWPDLVHQLQASLTSQNADTVYVGLLALKEVVKIYQWKSVDGREPLHQAVKLLFPTVQTTVSNLVNQQSEEAAEMLKLALKSYYGAIQASFSDFPKTLQDPASLVAWGTLFLQLVDKKVENEMTVSEDERERMLWWKAKKWAYHCLNRIFTRYGNPTLLLGSNTKYMGFAKNFVANFAPDILHAYLKQVDTWVKKEVWISSKCMALIAAFLTDCIKNKTMWQLVKPHSESLIAYFIFPQMCFSDSDAELWSEDPVEFVHKKIDPLEDFHSAQMHASNLLIDMARHRRKQTFMTILTFTNELLTKYLATAPELRNGKEKDGALNIVGCLSNEILSKHTVASMMEPFFVAHVFPEFSSPFPFLRARACSITRQFSDFDFASEENLSILYNSLLGCLKDNELPVKVHAALALQPMIRHEIVREAMVPNLPFIMQELLNLTNEIDADVLANVMEEFVEIFAEQLVPFAVQLCTQLRDTFLRIMEDVSQAQKDISEEDMLSGSANTDGVADKIMAAMGVLKTIGTLILSLQSTPEMLSQLETVLQPVISYTLENSIIDLYDEIFEIIDSCTFSAKTISEPMWNVLGLIYKAFKTSAVDFMDEMLPCLDNYISYGHQVICSSPEHQAMMYDIIETVMNSDRLGESDRVCACKLIESMLLNCRGHIDSYIPPFLNLAFQFIFANSMKTVEFRVHCLEVVINSLHYNPALTIRLLEENQWIKGFFSLWFQTVPKFSRQVGHFHAVHDKKLIVVSLCAILDMPFDQVPTSLRDGWPSMLDAIITAFQTLPKAIENREEMERYYTGDIPDDEASEATADTTDENSTDNGEDDNDEDDVEDEDAEYLEFLAQQANGTASQDDEEEEEEIGEEILFESPLDNVDPYITFAHAFKNLQQSQAQSYTLLTSSLNIEQQQQLMDILSTAEQHGQLA